VNSYDDDAPHHECGVFAIIGHPEAARLTYLGLYGLQHRGQESAGIISSDGELHYKHRGMGLVADVFDETSLDLLVGHMAVGHVRYSTAGGSNLNNAQPISGDLRHGPMAVAHNGTLVNANSLRYELMKSGALFFSTADSEVLLHLISHSVSENGLEDALGMAMRRVSGAFSTCVMGRSRLFGFRDPKGFRPLCIGKLDDSWILCSESCALDIINADYVREVAPGEIVELGPDGIKSYRYTEEQPETKCIFEYIYFAKPDSRIFGGSVYPMRKKIGAQLALECPVEADMVIPVPDSSTVAALGYSETSGIPYEFGIIRNHYIGRTFIEPQQRIRDFGAKIKYNPLPNLLEGKRVVIVDDSIVRGTTMRKIVKMIRRAGAKEIHLRVSSPMLQNPCYYGIDIPTRSELIAATHSLDEIAKHLRVDTLQYLSVQGLLKAADGLEGGFCDACFSGNYPVPFEDKRGCDDRIEYELDKPLLDGIE
jgi:amidophosphoribosyltransferase